jgi:pilus assembly protein FimV
MDKNKIIQAATRYVQKGQYDKAIKEYQRIIEEDPRDIRVLLKIGELHQKRGDNKESAATLLRVAEAYSNDGFFLKAAAVYKQVLKLNPVLLDVNLRLAELYQQLGLMSDAMQQYQLVANAYEKQGNSGASLNLFKKLVDLEPDNAASRVRLAEAYSKEGMNKEAIGELGKVATQLKQSGRNEEFIKVAERLLALDTQNLPLIRELANIYLQRGETKRALARLQTCFKADPRDIETLILLAQTFLDLGQQVKTISVYKELARIYGERGRREEEEAAWRRILALAPRDPDALVGTGQSAPPILEAEFEEVREKTEPREPSREPATVVATARSADPSRTEGRSAEVQKLLTEADVYLKYGLREKAAAHLRRILAAAPESVAAHQKAKELHLLTGNSAGAADELVQCAQLSLSEGNQPQAKVFLEQLRELAPGHAELARMQRLIGEVADLPELGEDEATLLEALPDDDEVVTVEALEEPADAELEEAEALVDAPDDELEPRLADEAVLMDGDEPFELDAEASQGDLVDEPLVDESLVEDSSEMNPAALAAAGFETSLEMSSASALDEFLGAAGRDAGAPEATPKATSPAPSPAFRRTLSGSRVLIPAPPPPAQVEAPPKPVELAQPEEDPAELAEAEFFIDQELSDEAAEALAVLRSTLASRPALRGQVERLEHRLAELRARDQSPAAEPSPPVPAEPTSESTGSFDLAAELEQEVSRNGEVEISQEDFQYSVEDVLSEFKRGIERVVRPEDVETHYDLGIAYKEMGLMDEAISEFEIALRGAEGKPKEADCLGLLGACRAARGDYAKALAAYGRAVKLKTLRPEGRLNLYFEIGSAREASGDLTGALEAYAQVAKVDPEYRDVSAAVARLSGREMHHPPLDPDLPLDESEPTLVGVRPGPLGKVASK